LSLALAERIDASGIFGRLKSELMSAKCPGRPIPGIFAATVGEIFVTRGSFQNLEQGQHHLLLRGKFEVDHGIEQITRGFYGTQANA
jgi:hypothetical protein